MRTARHFAVDLDDGGVHPVAKDAGLGAVVRDRVQPGRRPVRERDVLGGVGAARQECGGGRLLAERVPQRVRDRGELAERDPAGGRALDVHRAVGELEVRGVGLEHPRRELGRLLAHLARRRVGGVAADHRHAARERPEFRAGRRVSPAVTRTRPASRRGVAGESARTIVSWPWPWLDDPREHEMRPDESIRTARALVRPDARHFDVTGDPQPARAAGPRATASADSPRRTRPLEGAAQRGRVVTAVVDTVRAASLRAAGRRRRASRTAT